MASPRIEAVIRERYRMGECPVWEEETRQLVYVDINARTVCRWNPTLGSLPQAQRSYPRGIYMVASGTCLGLLDWETGQVEWAAWLDHDKPHNRFKDGKVDPTGRFEAGELLKGLAVARFAEGGPGHLESLSSWRVPTAGPAGHPNGLDWSLDHCTLYHVDSLVYSVRAYDYNVQTGGLANPRLVCQLEPEQGMPDGLCMDTTGTLWVACIDGGRVIRMDPETGTRLCTLEMPVFWVMSCCFQGRGADYPDLCVTSAVDSLSPEQLLLELQAGHIFKVSGVSLPGSAWLPATSAQPQRSCHINFKCYISLKGHRAATLSVSDALVWISYSILVLKPMEQERYHF
uniref:Regucalcin n=1 Tax=Marmota marmota marmota TaxID=9994 RepID=A0A8C5YYX0_MARMA